MPDRPDLTELERDAFDVVKVRRALPFLLAEARKTEALRMERDDARDEGFDQGRASVLGALVCSICAQDHDADESAACEGCKIIEFGEWAFAARAQVETLREALRRIAEFGEERSFSIPADQMACLARTALEEGT